MFFIFSLFVKMQELKIYSRFITLQTNSFNWSNNYLLRKFQPIILKYAVGGEGGLFIKRMQLQNTFHDIIK